jgi:hypothetical protein
MVRKTVNPFSTINRKKMANEITAREAHGAARYVLVEPREAPRTPRPPRRVYAALRTWLYRWLASEERETGWIGIARLADIATRDLDMTVDKSALGYVIRREFPGVPTRLQQVRKNDRFETIKNSVQYDTIFLKQGLDGDSETC